MQDRFWKLSEVASLLGVVQMTVYRWIWAGKVKAIKVGRSWRVAPEEVERIRRDGVIEEVEG